MKISFIQFVLSFWGYCKIPTEVIQLSLYLEDLVDRLSRTPTFKGTEPKEYTITPESLDEIKALLLKQIKGQKALTSFLRSGKLKA